ncbi:MAG: hypothetical protein AAB802_02335 [Patescibacteria group bacterium]
MGSPERRYDDERDHEQVNKSNLNRAQQEGRRLHDLVDHAGIQKRDRTIAELKDFSKETGIPEDEHIKDLEEARSNFEIDAKIARMKAAGIRWYTIQIDRSGVFDPVDYKEEASLTRERDELIAWFSGLSLSGSDMSMTKVLARLEKDLNPKKAFREKLKAQSTFVKKEYSRQLGSLPMVGSREKLLQNILDEIKDVINAPSAVQHEYKKVQKSATATKDTVTIRAEVMESYERRAAKYVGMVKANKDFFGGQDVDSKWGPVPITAKEFLEWFDELDSFAAMDSAIKRLPGLIQDRKELYEERDAILKSAKSEDRTRLTRMTDKMRRHELEEFMGTLESSVQENSIHVAEYVSELITARTRNLHLFTPFERASMSTKFKLDDVETQAMKLILLQKEIAVRERVVDEYFSLPIDIRDDQVFMRCHAVDREQMLVEAQHELENEPSHPFDTNSISDELESANNFEHFTEELEGSEGQELLSDVVEELEQEGEINDTLENTYWKIYGAAKRADRYSDDDQKDSYMRDLKFWMSQDQTIEKEKEATSERGQWKARFTTAAEKAYDLGKVVTVSGQISDLQQIGETELKTGSDKINEKLGRARYGEHVRINTADGKMAEDPLLLIEKLSQQELQRLVMMAITKLAGNLNVSSTAKSRLRNSEDVQSVIAQNLIDKEFSQLKGPKKT